MFWVLGVVAVAGDVDGCPESWHTAACSNEARRPQTCRSSPCAHRFQWMNDRPALLLTPVFRRLLIDPSAYCSSMSRVVVINHVTLDGVMQSPGRPEEDTRDGFTHGGWASPNVDEVVMTALGTRLGEGMRLLLGRRSYEGILGYWNTQDSPFTPALNNADKYVASRTLSEPLPWPNSTLLRGDVSEAVAQLRQQPGSDMIVMGSGELIQTLIREQLIDQYLLMVHPLVLGSGRRLFADGTPPARLRLVDSVTSTTGVVIATYQPDRA